MPINEKARNTIKLISLSVFSGLILTASWPINGVSPLLFIGFIPLLFIENYFYQKKKRDGKKIIFYAYIAFFIWNLLTTWWVYKASLFGGAAAVICNAFFMALVFQMFHFTRVKLGNFIGYSSFVFYWIGFEFLHLNWDLSWPWLTLGNGFASFTNWIQWYEYTGILGGSAWILILNLYLFFIIRKYIHDTDRGRTRIILYTFSALLLILVPYVISISIYSNYKEKRKAVQVVVVQPNIDPYNEKFAGTEEAQLNKFISLAKQKIDQETDYLIGPETALPEGIWEEEIQNTYSIQLLNHFLLEYPNLKIVTGLASYKHIHEKSEESSATRDYADPSQKYEAYNTAIQLGPAGKIELYHKSKLVPGVEQMPYPALFKYIEKFAIDLGGTSGSLGKQKERSLFHSKENISVGTAICYESIYGDFMSGFVRNGANILFIITNDGWWGDTPGYKQHLNYGRLRAIEFRRNIARSANTGISCFINSLGEISQATEWWKPAVIKSEINSNDEISFYAKYGDYIGRICSGLTIILFLISLIIKKN